jgi:Flp pilus assembly protein TadD
MLKYRQILPLLLLAALTGCTGSWKPKWISRLRPGTEERRTADNPAEPEDVDGQKQLATHTDTEAENPDAELAAVERQSRLIRDAQTALRAENPEDARRLYREVLHEAPDHPDAHHGLAMAADLDEDWDDAEYHYKQALKIRPQDAVLLSDIGYSYVLQNRYAEATRYLNQAIELQPSYERAHMNLALLDLRQGNRTAAEQRLVQRLGNSAKTASILASLERQAFPDTAVAAAPRPESHQPAPGMSLEQVQEIARKERALAEQRRNDVESTHRSPEPWLNGNPLNSRTPASTVSGNPSLAPQPQSPAFASQSATYPNPLVTDPSPNAESWPHGANGYTNTYAPAESQAATNQLPPPQGYSYAGYPGPDNQPSGYPPVGYPPVGYPNAGYPISNQPNGGYPDQGYVDTGYPASNYPASNYPAEAYQAPRVAESDYPPADREPLSGESPSYAAVNQQMRVGLSGDRPSGKLTLPNQTASTRPNAGETRPGARPTPESAADGATWSSNAPSNATGIAVSPPVPIRSSSAGTTAGAESYGQPAGFNRGLPSRMRVVESAGGQSGFPVYGADSGFRTEGLNIGPGSLFPPVEPQRSQGAPQRSIMPAGYSDTNAQSGVVPAWGGARRQPAREASRDSAAFGASEVPAAYPEAWPAAAGNPSPNTAGPEGREAPVAPEPTQADRALQSYRDQMQQINSQFNRSPPPASYNDSRR